MLSIDDILKPDDLPVKKVRVPEWGGEACIRTMRADERDDMETRWLAIRESHGNDNKGFRGFMVACCLCDETGKPLFENPNEVYERIGAKSAAAVNRLFNVACKLNGLTKEDEEELAKN